MPKTVDKEALKDAIRLRILLKEFPPGEAIDENRLAREMGVSRTPVHDVVIVLLSEGLVEYARNQGYKARGAEISDMRGFFEVADTLFEPVMRLAAERRSQADLDAMADRLEAIEASRDEEARPARIAALRGFLLACAAASANDSFERMMGIAVNRYLMLRIAAHDRATVAMQRREIETVIETCTALRDAIRDGDEEAAAAAVRTMVERAREFFMAQLFTNARAIA
jgi:DNA-binding GntR family transcriptional regulator